MLSQRKLLSALTQELTAYQPLKDVIWAAPTLDGGLYSAGARYSNINAFRATFPGKRCLVARLVPVRVAVSLGRGRPPMTTEPCPACGGVFEVRHTARNQAGVVVRYMRCRGCGLRDKIVELETI